MADDTVDTAVQAIWDAAWVLHEGQPDWKPSKRLSDAIDALIAAVRAENAPPSIDDEMAKLKTVMTALRKSGLS